MKKNILVVLSIFGLVCSHTFAQKFEFSDSQNHVIRDTLIVQIAPNATVEAYIHVKSLSSTDSNIIVGVDLACAPNLNTSTICTTPGRCYTGGRTNAFNLAVDSSVEVHVELEATNPLSVNGEIVVFYVETQTVTPSVEKRHIKFVPTATNTILAKDKTVFAEVYPNPASTAATFQYNLPIESREASIVIRNMVGNIVKNISLENGVSAQKKVNVSDLSAGVYFYSYIVDGNIISTKKLVVRH